MSYDESVSHFWVAGSPFFASTLLVATAAPAVIGDRLSVACELFDVDGQHTNAFEVGFPADEVGVIELEPFMAGLKMRGGIQQGHLVARSAVGSRHWCRQQMGSHFDLLSSPTFIKVRETCFAPMILGVRREHLVVLVNASEELAQVVVRLMYGTRSPEWNLQIPARGCLTVSLEDELLSTFDDSTWRKGATQGYLRVSCRSHAAVSCQIIERVRGEGDKEEQFRCMTSW